MNIQPVFQTLTFIYLVATYSAAVEEGSQFRGANELRRKIFDDKKLNPMEDF